MKQEIICGDCIPVMAGMSSDSVAACITDPPYNYEFIGHTWDSDEINRRLERVQDSSTLIKNIPYGSGLAGGVRNQRWYERNRDSVAEYTRWCEQWSCKLYRICKAGAPVAVFSSTRSAAHIQVALESAGFYARDILVYRRSSGIPKGLNLRSKLEKLNHPESAKWEGWHTCFRGEWEAVVLVQKPLQNNYWQTLQETGVGVFKTINSDGSFQSNILEGFNKERADKEWSHCTVKPVSLVKKLLQVLVPKTDSNVVLDPFLGSGTTLVAARELGYSAIGIEIDSDYAAIARGRLDSLDLDDLGQGTDSPQDLTGSQGSLLLFDM